MRIMTWGCAETTVVMLARQDELDSLRSRESIRMAEKMQSRQAPVDAIQTQVLGEPIFQFISALQINQPENGNRKGSDRCIRTRTMSSV